jgi:hypothetical protein
VAGVDGGECEKGEDKAGHVDKLFPLFSLCLVHNRLWHRRNVLKKRNTPL